MIRLSVIIFLLVTSSCFAQDSTAFEQLIPRYALKFAPMTMVNFYPTAELSFEQKLIHRITAQFAFGYVLYYNLDQDPAYQNKRGNKIKLELRYYTFPSLRYSLSYYFALEGYMNTINFDRETSQEECYDISCTHSYTRYYNYVVNNRERGFSLKFGFIRHLSKHFFMDINGGLTLRFIDYNEPTLPTGINNMFQDQVFLFGEFPNEEDRIDLTPLLGFRIGYQFK